MDQEDLKTQKSDNLEQLFPDLADTLANATLTMEGILALRARLDQLIRQRNNGGPWGPEQMTEFQQTSELLGWIDQEQAAKERSLSKERQRKNGHGVLRNLFSRKPR